MTGSTAHFGQDADKALHLAVDEANASGCVLGKPVKVATLEDRGDSAEAAMGNVKDFTAKLAALEK